MGFFKTPDLGKYKTLKGWEVPTAPGTLSPTGDNRWSNRDMDPVPWNERKWNAFHYVAYWMSDTYGTNGLAAAGSMLSLGLNWWQAVLAIVAGNAVISWVCVANGTIGARLGTSFSVLVRGSFGFWFSYLPVVFRLVIAVVWYGVNTYTGGLGTYAALRAIWPSLTTYENHLSTSSGISSKYMISFFVFFVFQTAISMVNPVRLRWFFAAKAIIGPAAGLSMMGYYVHKSDGALYAGNKTLSGTALAWAWLTCFNSSVGSYSTLGVNIADFTRYAKRPRSQYIQVIILPLTTSITAIMGVFLASGAQAVYGGAIQFNPLYLLDKFTNRAALFFLGAAFSYCQLCTNISSNGLSAANDWTVLFPKYLNLRRGAVLTSVIGCWAMLPWKVLADAVTFLSFMGSYVIFMAPISGIIIADYWIVKRQRVDLPALYDPSGRYRYIQGANWRAGVTLLVSIAPQFPGFLNKVNAKIAVSAGVKHFYTLAFPFCFITSVLVFTALSLAFPAKEIFLDESILDLPGYSAPHAADPREEDVDEKDVEVGDRVLAVDKP